MEYLDDQDREITSYNLYCLNAKCKASIYHHPKDIEVPFDLENLSATHLCPCCDNPLVSKMDMEIKKMVAEIALRTGAPTRNTIKKERIKSKL